MIMKSTLKIIFSAFFYILMAVSVHAQQMIDGIVAVVGDYTVMQSEIEQQALQSRGNGIPYEDLKCALLQQYLQEKLLLDQAKIDSLEVTESEVNNKLDQNMEYFIRNFGSREELEAYFKKSVLEIKEDFREGIRNQILSQKMQFELTKDIKITPSEVKAYFNSLNPDSIPSIDALVEVAQIVIYPPLGEKSVYDVRQKLLDLRKRIMDGESFETLAILYSEDGSASNGGEIGYMGKGQLDPEYAKAAFSLKTGQVSKIVESEFGYHIIQLIDRKEDRINTRHILLKPVVSSEAKKKAIERLDSVMLLINNDSLTFEDAAIRYSEDKKSRLNHGKVVNPLTNSSLFELKEMETKDYLTIRDLKVGEVSKAYETVDENKKSMYKVVKLKSRTDPHKANLRQDYVLIQNMAMANKRTTMVQDWINEKLTDTYIHVDSRFLKCPFMKESAWSANNLP